MNEQTLTDCQEGIGSQCGLPTFAALPNSNKQTANEAKDCDQKRGDGVAANELGCTVHCAVKVRFKFKSLSPRPRFLFRDETCGQVSIYAHLLARQGVKGETSSDLGNSVSATSHDGELDDEKCEEQNDADEEVTAKHEFARCFDKLTCVPARQNGSHYSDR